jgi:phosphatidylethanolamine/phosphatidyl-N-methylethanolamine N-methyltransferase
MANLGSIPPIDTHAPELTMTLLAHLIQASALTGAVAPSSQFLARAMADAAQGAGHIVELGAGTGPVTRVLTRRYPEVRLTVVELQPTLAGKLSRAYPRALVHAKPAAEVLDQLGYEGLPVAIVSSLPFRSMPALVRMETRNSVLQFLRRNPGSWLVQFTYQPRAPFDGEHGFAWRRKRTVVANIPPAGVWTLRATP